MSKFSRAVAAMKQRAIVSIEKHAAERESSDEDLGRKETEPSSVEKNSAVRAMTGGSGPTGGSGQAGGGEGGQAEPGANPAAGIAESASSPPGVASPAPKRKGAVIRFERGGFTPDVFPDGDVCRLIGKNRNYLIKARKTTTRGLNWDVVDQHAGMTAFWILQECPAADIGKILPWRVKPGDGVVSVEVVQHTTNGHKLICKRLSDGKTVVVTVDDASRFLAGDQFDAQELAGTLRWNVSLNRTQR